MAIFFKLNDKVYKSNNSVTIGRGAPFDELSDHRDIARAHCKLHYKNKKIHITRLSDKGQVFINGESIPVNKEVAVSTSDSLKIGELVLETFRSYEGKDYAVVKGFYAKDAGLSKAILIIFAIVFVILTFMGPHGIGAIGLNLIMSVIITTIIGCLYSLMFLLVMAIYQDEDPREVFIGKNGLTLHYKKTNMSIMFSDIEHLYKKSNQTFIHAHGEVFSIRTIKNGKKLFDILLDRVPLSARNTKPKKFDDEVVCKYIFYTAVLVALVIYLMVDSIAKDILIMTVLSTSMLIAAPFMRITNSKNYKVIFRNQLIWGFCNIFMVYASYSEYNEISTHEDYLKRCIHKEVEYCQKIDPVVLRGYKKIKSDLKQVCSINKATCEKWEDQKHKNNNRSTASKHHEI